MELINNKTIIFFSLIFIMSLWEKKNPSSYPKPSISNKIHSLFISMTNTFFNKLLLPLGVVGSVKFLHSYAPLYQNPLENFQTAYFITSFLILDLAIYFQHRLFHLIPSLWRLHRAHHSAAFMDVTLGLRFHPIEIILSACIRIIIISCFSLSIEAYMIFDIWLMSCSMFHHGAIKLPKRFETFLGYFIITPRLHLLHHSIKSSECHSNFGFSFSLWDQLFKSRTSFIDPQNFELGVRGFQKDSEQKTFAIWKSPFKKML